MLTRDQILSASDHVLEKVNVHEWGGEIFVRTLTGAQRDKFESLCTSKMFTNIRASLAVWTVCDESGKPLFTEADIVALGNKSAAPLQRIFAVAMKLNAVSDDDVKELEKN